MTDEAATSRATFPRYIRPVRLVRPFGLALTLAALALGPAACGDGGDEGEIENAVIKAAKNPDDPEIYCSLITRRFKQQITNETGEAADDACADRVAKADVKPANQVELGKIRVSNATARAEATIDGTSIRVELLKEDGTWKLTGAGLPRPSGATP